MSYTSKEVIQRTGVTYRQLDHWCRTGYLGDRLKAAPGSGFGRTFTWNDVKLVDMALCLVRLGFCNERAFTYARRVLDDGRISLVLGVASVTVRGAGKDDEDDRLGTGRVDTTDADGAATTATGTGACTNATGDAAEDTEGVEDHTAGRTAGDGVRDDVERAQGGGTGDLEEP